MIQSPITITFTCITFLIAFLQPAVNAVDCTHKYKVKSGDNCWDISRAYGLNNDKFMAFNGIPSDCKSLPVGTNSFKIIDHLNVLSNEFLGWKGCVRWECQLQNGFEMPSSMHVGFLDFIRITSVRFHRHSHFVSSTFCPFFKLIDCTKFRSH